MILYDNLNRIRNSLAINAKQEWSRFAPNDWNNSTLANLNTSYNYDPSGNLSDLTRTDSDGNLFDDFHYNYNANTNQLNYIEDANIDDALRSDDIDNQSVGNSSYDRNGRLVSDVHDGITNIIWTRDNRPKQVTKNFNGINEVINYHYDFQGFKIIQVINRNDSVFKQHYVRDPQGSVLAIYTDTSAINYQKLTLSELSIYGSSRIGTIQLDSVLYKQNGTNILTPTISNKYSQKLGLKRYELSNHLGNVSTVISDRKLVESHANGQITAYKADVVSVTDYYAFGMKIEERSWGKDARYQYNGKEQDKGMGRYNFDGRMYDERSCRWMSLDPQAAKYAGISPYVGFANNPIMFVDPNGEDIILSGKEYNGHLITTLKAITGLNITATKLKDGNYKLIISSPNSNEISLSSQATALKQFLIEHSNDKAKILVEKVEYDECGTFDNYWESSVNLADIGPSKSAYGAKDEDKKIAEVKKNLETNPDAADKFLHFFNEQLFKSEKDPEGENYELAHAFAFVKGAVSANIGNVTELIEMSESLYDNDNSNSTDNFNEHKEKLGTNAIYFKGIDKTLTYYTIGVGNKQSTRYEWEKGDNVKREK